MYVNYILILNRIYILLPLFKSFRISSKYARKYANMKCFTTVCRSKLHIRISMVYVLRAYRLPEEALCSLYYQTVF